MRNSRLPALYQALVSLSFLFLGIPGVHGQTNFRIHPYLQVYENGKIQITWFGNQPLLSRISIGNGSGDQLFNSEVHPVETREIYYTSREKEQVIPGLENGSWLEGEKAYKYRVTAAVLPPGKTLEYTVTLGAEIFASTFKTAPDKYSWESLRFVALSDSETEPIGRVTHRTWYPGVPAVRPFAIPPLWKEKFGTGIEHGLEILNYMLSERDGYAANLRIINSRNPDFMLMPGDLVQGGGYQPGWDEFFRHNAGEFDKGLTRYPVLPALGNWESFGGINGGYGFTENGEFAPVLGRNRFQTYFETPTSDPLQKHRQSYYRVDYGPVTILTMDSGNGTPEQTRSDFPQGQKIKGRQYAGPGTDTQENFTLADYEANGGNDLSGFAPGTDQYIWLEHHLKTASDSGQLIFVQFHHSPYSSGEHGLPMNHELSSGQGGTPLRGIHPLLEKHGVIAVLAGHDELFERSFVDEDGDGRGVFYYDVGVAGDGMRGEKRDLLNDPSQPLNYNVYKKWTADQNSPEVWNTTGLRPFLEDGGKHYGHLEVNLEKIVENGKEYAKIRFSPVYVFPVLDAEYNLQRIERRIYPDEIELKILLNSRYSPPRLRESVTLNLDKSGIAKINPADLFTTLGSFQISEITLSENQFDCQDIGTNLLKVTAQKGDNSRGWAGEIQIDVSDTISPTVVVKSFHTELDLRVGAVTLNAEDFVSAVGDNCGVEDVSIDKTSVSCTEGEGPIDIGVTVVDQSGNRRIERAELFVSVTGYDEVRISGDFSFCEGAETELRLEAAYGFEVISWYRDNQVYQPDLPATSTLEVNEPGEYYAKIRYAGGCTSTSERRQVLQNDLPHGEVKVEGNELSAPEGDFAYRWFKNEEVIEGATTRTLTVTETGDFAVELTDPNGCAAVLNPVAVVILGLSDPLSQAGEKFKIYPNPSSGLVKVTIPAGSSILVESVEIYDLNGRERTPMVGITQSGPTGLVLDISRLAFGVYLILLEGYQGEYFLGRVVKLGN